MPGMTRVATIAILTTLAAVPARADEFCLHQNDDKTLSECKYPVPMMSGGPLKHIPTDGIITYQYPEHREKMEPLYELPNGTWINLSTVMGITPIDSDMPIGPYVSVDRQNGQISLYFNSFEAARAYAATLAKLVNEAKGKVK